MAYHYKYEQGLIRRTSPVALLRGSVLHEMLDCRVLGTDPLVPLAAYRNVYKELWDEEREKYPSPEDLQSIYQRYSDHYAGEGMEYQGTEVTIMAEHDGLKFKGIIDKLVVDHRRLSWVMDHKTHKVIPDENNRFADIQTVLYWWALRENKQPVDGVLWDYIRTKVPTVPEVLKKGGLTRRKDLDSDYDTYLKALEENELDPADYQVELERLKENVFFKRVLLPRPSEVLVQNVVEDFFDTAREIENSTSKCRNMTRNCTSCSYFQLCQAEYRGLDGEFLRKQMFTIRGEEEVPR